MGIILYAFTDWLNLCSLLGNPTWPLLAIQFSTGSADVSYKE